MKNRVIQMKSAIHCILIFLLINTVYLTNGTAQSTMGTDFWVTFLPQDLHSYVEHQLSLIASGPRSCSCSVTNPYTNWSQTFTINPNNTTIVNIPYEQAYEDISDCIINKGLHIISSDTISLFASNFQVASFDVTDVLPTQSLGTDYVIQSYSATFKRMDNYSKSKVDRHDCSEFSVIATEDGTTISILLSCNSSNGHYANQPFSVTLNTGQCYQVQSISYGDLSGSRISVTNNKKVAVFAGNLCAKIPAGCSYCDHLVEQMMPVPCWGQHFVITNSLTRSKDIIRVTASNDNCQIYQNGTLLTTIDANQTYEFVITSNTPSAYLETSEPVMVYLYLTSSTYGGSNGDPSMVIISPLEQMIGSVTFSTFNYGNARTHYVNVITDSDKVSGMQIDGNSITSQFQAVEGNSDYSFARFQVGNGSHTLSNPNGGFVGHIYGLGDVESYAYSVGSMVFILTSQMLVDGQITSNFPNGFDVCVNDPISFDLNLNFSFSQANWTFGDGETGTGCPLTHSYDNPGDYTVSCDVYKLEEGQNVLATTLTTELHVHSSYQEEVNETNCDSYTWMGQIQIQSGDYTYQGQTTHGCDSIVTLHLTINHSDTTYLNITACDEYEWYGTTISEPGVYTHLEQTIEGCDSLLVLNLDISGSYSLEESITSCNSYYWRGNTYTESGTYTDLVQTPGACDSTFVLHLTLGYDVQSDTTTIACNAFAWHGSTYTETGDYYYMSQTALGCDSTVVLHLTINPSDTTYLNITACDEYEWYGTTISEPGVYTHLEQTIEGCDSLLVLNLDISGSYSSEESITSCNSYYWRGNTYTESGTYTDFVYTPDACDSTFVLHLTLGYDVQSDTTAYVCEEFVWYGHTYTETGQYEHMLQTALGCDSLIILNLNVGDISSVTENITACNSYWWRGDTYLQSGTYTDMGYNPAGCDTIFTLNLTLGHDATGDTIATRCEPIIWYGNTYSESGDYTHLLQTSLGCDSLLTLHLTIGNEQVHPTQVAETCESSYLWHGHNYSHSGIYYDTIVDVAGCNDIYVLDLTFSEGYSISLNETICDLYPWAGSYLTESGYYRYEGQSQDGCDSIVDLNLTVNYTPGLKIDGLSQVAMTTDFGPFYTYYALDTIGVEPCSVTWSCSNPEWVVVPVEDSYKCMIAPTTLGQAILTAVTHCATGCDAFCTIEINSTYYNIEENEEDGVLLFPNPTNSQVTIHAHQLKHIRMFDNYGQILKDFSYQNVETVIVDVSDLSPCVYFMEITTANGSTVKHLIVLR